MMDKWCVFANSLLLIRSAIAEWSDQLFFLLLYRLKLEEDGLIVKDSEAPLAGSIFDDILKQYKNIQKQFVEALITNISSAFKRATTNYLKKKKIWNMPAETVDISGDLCTGLEDLGTFLSRAAAGLAPRLFGKVWRGVATALDMHIVSAILPPTGSHVFSAGGVGQLGRDVEAILLLFRPYTPHPENHFKGLSDVCKILKLPDRERQLLQERIMEEERERGGNGTKEILAQYGILRLDDEQTFAVCKMRVS